MSHDAYEEYTTEGLRVDERKTYSYGMARHGTHIGAADTSNLVL